MRPTCYTSSSIGPCPNLNQNFLDRPESVSMTWDDAFFLGSLRDDKSWFKVYHQCEPPEVLDVIDRLAQIHRYYDLIMAWDDRVLRECPNAVFLTESGCSWLDRKNPAMNGGKLSPFPLNGSATGVSPYQNMEGWAKSIDHGVIVPEYKACDVSQKRFEVAFLTSSKGFTVGHKLRLDIFDALPELIGSLKIWKHRSPPRIPDKREVLEPRMFAISPENSQHNGYYSEKLVDCFIAKTFPLYWGCPSLSRYFNPDGYMYFENVADLLQKLEQLTPEFYASRLPAIEENHRIALQSVHQWDMMENYITHGIERKKAGLSPVVPEPVTTPELGVRIPSPSITLRRPLRRCQ